MSVSNLPEASDPRIEGSAISEMYIGAYTKLAPPPTPPMNLAIRIGIEDDENSMIIQHNCKRKH